MAKKKTPPNPLPCGCGIKGTPGNDPWSEKVEYTKLHIVYCQLHTAAPEMLELLDDAEHDIRQHALPDKDWLEKVRKVLAKAKGLPQ